MAYTALMRGISVLLALLIFIAFVTVFIVPLRHGKKLPGSATSTDMTADTSHPFFKLTSGAFANGALIPSKYTCDAMPALARPAGGDRQGARDLSPSLSIAGVPAEATSLALIMDDPDVPKALRSDGVFDHWTLFNIPADTKEITEGKSAGVIGANSAGQNAYTGPCPPKEYEPSEHRYIFTLYALDIELPLSEDTSKAVVLEAMQGHIIAQTQLIGRYKRK